MKETGIIMSDNHPRLIIDSLKSMTRRTWGLEKVNHNPDDWEFKRLNNDAIALFWRSNIMDEDISLCKYPYGQVGDRLWVRETWCVSSEWDKLPPSKLPIKARKTIIYKADGFERTGRWRSSRFMPRWASWITLEITEVRAERVQEITPADCLAEGIKTSGLGEYGKWIISFQNLWDSLNAKRGYGWETNPWVW